MLGSKTKTALEMLKVNSCSEFQNKTLYHPPDQRCMNAISKADTMCQRYGQTAKIPILAEPSFFKWVANQYDI